MGSGDWNDGMNLVGIEGKGESVWLGFFLYAVLTEFEDIARIRGDVVFMRKCSEYAAGLKDSISSESWDGEWFLRGFFDDGTTLGSSGNRECRIDSISQSWSVLSGAASPERQLSALRSLDSNLVDNEFGIIHLLDPPFNESLPEPGYIKGYPPGIRENGGQYTHAAVWAAMAFARHGDDHKMESLLSMLNPVSHGSTPEGIDRYKVEPYVMAADIYSAEPYQGRGGWTWYTGSASWMYRFIIESVFGLNILADKMTFTPCIPSEWKESEIHYRYRETMYHVVYHRNGECPITEVRVDDELRSDFTVTLEDDRRDHYVTVIIGTMKDEKANQA